MMECGSTSCTSTTVPVKTVTFSSYRPASPWWAESGTAASSRLEAMTSNGSFFIVRDHTAERAAKRHKRLKKFRSFLAPDGPGDADGGAAVGVIRAVRGYFSSTN